ncbi:acetyltransferase [Sporosarcina sp. FSL K6-2383]|uniref:acetyltransferase n=1 Tax=Sporosarcina sp. FSL K6-2383 TaxID=2921556 RepID=UPI00315A46E9
MNKPVIIIGNGGHASVLVEILIAQQREIIGYTAPREGTDLFSLPYLRTDDVITNYNPEEIDLVLGLGTINISSQRKLIFEEYKARGFTFANVIHSMAIVSPSARIGQGVQIMAGAIIQTNVVLQDNVIINTGSIIDHGSTIGSHAHLAPGTTLSGGVSIGGSCHIGTGASIIQGIAVGNETLIGAGSVVVTDIESNKKAFGVPAKEV